MNERGPMSRRLTNAIVTVGLSLWLSVAAYAQEKSFELNLFGGGSWYSIKKYQIGAPQSPVPVPGEFRLDKALRGGLRVGVYTRGHWSEEFFYSYEPNKAHILRTSTTPPTSADFSIQAHNYGMSGLYYFSDDESRHVRPFVSFGLGGILYRLTPQALAFLHDPLRGDLLNAKNSNEVALNYGFGVKTRAAKWLGFRADVRGTIGGSPAFGLAKSSSDPNATVFPVSGPLQNAEATVGLVIYLFPKR
jgi:hypothetical protein